MMLGKLSQFKNFISQAVTSVSSQRPTAPSDPQLQSKLKYLLDYILRNGVQEQFRVYHSLQGPQMTLNQLLRQIYRSGQADTTQIASIIHFFTFLLINCNNQLVLCKIVSDSFVAELTEVCLTRLGKDIENANIELQEINSYKIALIKAYVSRINSQTIKYMVINSRMPVFGHCLYLYQQYIETDQQNFGVQATCISNCILLILRYLAAHPQEVSCQQSDQGIADLLLTMVGNIHSSILTILQASELHPHHFESLQDKILFLLDVITAMHSPALKMQLVSQTNKEMGDLRELFKQIVLQHTSQPNQTQQNYIKGLQLIKVLLKLLAIYYSSEQLLPLFSDCLLPLLRKFSTLLQARCKQITQELEGLREEGEIKEALVESVIGWKEKIMCILCSNMEIVAVILKNGDYLMRRNSTHHKEQELKTVITNILVDILELLMGEEGKAIQELICYKAIKCLLLSLMHLTVQNEHTLHQYSVVKLHQFVIDHLRKQLKKTQLWDHVVLNYETFLKNIGENLLNVDQLTPQEYSFCQFHDPNRVKVPLPLDCLLNAIFINESCRNFRFMIVEKTGVCSKDIKLQKNYHNNFRTPGWNYEPGKQIEEPLPQVCRLSHLSKGVSIPITVLQDEDCLLFAHNQGQTQTVLLNIRFKSIQGFTLDRDIVRIKLKGLQQVLVEATSRKQRGQVIRFKEYLVRGRDRARERELKFIHHYLNLYYEDNQKLISQMGEEDIDNEETKQAQTKDIDPSDGIETSDALEVRGERAAETKSVEQEDVVDVE